MPVAGHYVPESGGGGATEIETGPLYEIEDVQPDNLIPFSGPGGHGFAAPQNDLGKMRILGVRRPQLAETQAA